MTAETQGAAGSQQLYLGIDVERVQDQHDSGSDLPIDMQKDITEPNLRLFISTLYPEKMKTELSYPLVVRLMYQWGKSSDKVFRHLFRQITISPSKENLFWAKTLWDTAMCNSFVPGVCSSLGLPIMAVLGSVLNAPVVVNNYLTS